jgi:hypothetical protein
VDRRVIACNYTEAVSPVSAGALCYVTLLNPGNGHERIKILARSRSGRWIEKWEDTRRLSNFRLKTLPPEHPLHADERIWSAVDPLLERGLDELQRSIERGRAG